MSVTRTRTRYVPPTDPLVVGGRFLSGYWRREYDVLAITRNTWGGVASITVRWVDEGRVGTHCTAWDKGRDRVVWTPDSLAEGLRRAEALRQLDDGAPAGDPAPLPDTLTAQAVDGHLYEYKVIGRYPGGALKTQQYNARHHDNCDCRTSTDW